MIMIVYDLDNYLYFNNLYYSKLFTSSWGFFISQRRKRPNN